MHLKYITKSLLAFTTLSIQYTVVCINLKFAGNTDELVLLVLLPPREEHANMWANTVTCEVTESQASRRCGDGGACGGIDLGRIL